MDSSTKKDVFAFCPPGHRRNTYVDHGHGSRRVPREAVEGNRVPVEAIKFRMEQLELSRKDLERYIGSRARVSEVLNGQRSLSLKMIRKLHSGLDIPLESLVGTT